MGQDNTAAAAIQCWRGNLKAAPKIGFSVSRIFQIDNEVAEQEALVWLKWSSFLRLRYAARSSCTGIGISENG
jgi:hypothetical protein